MRVNKKKLPEIHIDIASHNANPRKRTARKNPVKKTVKRVKNPAAPKPSMVARYWVYQEHQTGKDFVCACKDKKTADIIAAMLQKMAQPGVKFTVQRVY